MNHRLLFETVTSISTIISTDVVQMGTTSVTHMMAANMNMEITRCSTTVRSGMPMVSGGIIHAISPSTIARANDTNFLVLIDVFVFFGLMILWCRKSTVKYI